jgi:membrane protein DedA with SNARE-associated domain
MDFKSLYEAPFMARIVIGLVLLLIGYFVIFVLKIAFSVLWLIFGLIGAIVVLLVIAGIGVWVVHGKDTADVLEDWERAFSIWWRK